MSVGSVLLYQGMTVWFLAVSQHFGWSYAQLSLAFTLTRLVGLAEPLVGYLTDRYGPRRLVLTGLCILAAGFAFFGLIQNLWGLYTAFAIMAAGSILCGTIPLVVMLSRWFVRRRDTSIAIVLMAPSLGALVLVPVIAWSLEDGGLWWREVAFILAGVIPLVALLGLSRLRDRPEDMGLLPYGVPPAAQQVSLSFAQTLRARAFWLIAFGNGFTSMASLSVMTYLGLLMTEKGYAVLYAGWVVSAHTIVNIVFILVGVYLGYRLPKRFVLSFFSALSAIGLLALLMADSLFLFFAFAVIFGAGSGGIFILSITILPDYFGTASLGKILGVSALPASLLVLIAALLVGFMVDALGSYTLSLLVMAGLSLLGAFLFLKARPPQLPATDAPPVLSDQQARN